MAKYDWVFLSLPPLTYSTPWICWPAVELISTLATDEDWIALGNREDWKKNGNHHKRSKLENEIALHTWGFI